MSSEVLPEETGVQLNDLVSELIQDWDERVKHFRRRFLDATDPVERNRMRAKADTLHYAMRELIEAQSYAKECNEEEANEKTWPGLGGILNGSSSKN